VRFVDEEPQPGIVEAQFRDAQGQTHSIIDKIPMFATDADLWSDSEYPQSGAMACRVLERIPGPPGASLAHITIAEPYDVETIDGRSEFMVNEADLLD
jgi:hypothetical protein